jgi:sRNA-binding carbon storage regulator CsrA
MLYVDGVDEAHVANSANTELDLLGILEKIRKLQYRSMEMFVGDFKIVRDKVKEKLIRTLNDTVAMNTSPLMQAIETLMDVVNMSVLKRAEALVNLEAAVQRECGESVAESVELEHVASVSIEDDDKRISINNPSECSIIRDKIVLEVIAEKQGVAVVECGSSNDILNREGADENARNYDDIFLSSFDPDFHVPYFFLQVIAYLKTNYDATSGKRLIARRDEVVIESMRRNFGFALGVYRKREGKWTSKALPTMTLTCEAYYINLFVAGDQMNSADGEILLAFIDKFEGLLYDYAEVWFDMLSPIGKECLRWGFTERNGIAAVAPLVHFKRLPPLVYFAELLKDVSHFHTGLNDGVGLARASGRPAIQQRLQALWRANCDHTFGLCSLSPVDAPYHQHALSVSAWTTLIESPPIPPNSQVSVDGGAEEKAVASLLRSASDMDAVNDTPQISD